MQVQSTATKASTQLLLTACSHHCEAAYVSEALLFSIPRRLVFIQKRHPHIGNLNSETCGDSKNAFLHCGDAAQVEPFLVSPLGFNLRERGRRKDLLRQHSQHIKLGLQEEHLPQELQLSYIRYPQKNRKYYIFWRRSMRSQALCCCPGLPVRSCLYLVLLTSDNP